MSNQFFYRPPAPVRSPDYISIVNAKLYYDPRSVDANSELYQNAIRQYNASITNASTERLEVPEGFCGYIDPESGEFRVEPRTGAPFFFANSPVIATPIVDIISSLDSFEWPSDECLKPNSLTENPLPGSPHYSQIITDDGKIQPRVCTGTKASPISATGMCWGTETPWCSASSASNGGAAAGGGLSNAESSSSPDRRRPKKYPWFLYDAPYKT